MVATTSKFIGRGAYSVADAARIVGRHYNTIRRWLNPDDGIIARAYDPDLQTISFAELMELHFIEMFESKGVSFQTIRRAAEMASKQFHTDYPFTVKRFDTDGRTIFATLADEAGKSKKKKKVLVEDLKTSQLVFGQIVKPFFKKLDYGKSDISRYWPLHKRGRVVLDPSRSFGQPIDDQTGVPTKTLFEALHAGKGQTIKEVARWFDVPESAVRAAVKFEKSLSPQ
jgi:uncharacterized protein (DUF433 family)